MSHIIPPLVSDSPPPMVSGGSDDLDDEFGDFAVPGDISFDGYSLPSSPLHHPNSSYNTTSISPSIPECPHNITKVNLQSNIMPNHFHSPKYSGNDSKCSVSVENKCDTNVHISPENEVSLSVEKEMINVPKLSDKCCEKDTSENLSVFNSEIYVECDVFQNNKNHEDIDSDEFGDFTTCTVDITQNFTENAKTVNEPSEVIIEDCQKQTLNVSEDLDDFGDFETCPKIENNGKTKVNTEISQMNGINKKKNENFENMQKEASQATKNTTKIIDDIHNVLSEKSSNVKNSYNFEDEKTGTHANSLDSDLEFGISNSQEQISYDDDSEEIKSTSLFQEKLSNAVNNYYHTVVLEDDDEDSQNNSTHSEKASDAFEFTFDKQYSFEEFQDSLIDSNRKSETQTENEANQKNVILDSSTNNQDTKVSIHAKSDIAQSEQNSKNEISISGEVKTDSFDDKETMRLDYLSENKNDNQEFGEFGQNQIEILSDLDSEEEKDSFANHDILNENKLSDYADNEIGLNSISSKIVSENTYSLSTSNLNTEFGEFESKIENRSEFADFKSNISETKATTTEFEKYVTDTSKKSVEKNAPSHSEDSDFADFESSPSVKLNESEFGTFETAAISDVHFEADFSDFKTSEPNIDDDFGDFNDYSTQSASTELKISYSEDEIFNVSEKIFKECFPLEKIDVPDCETEDLTDNDVFQNLREIETTNALNFQWSTSETQKLLLKSLNIDSRNILYGPRWNPSMPKYASNLGFAPLEPQKTELTQQQTTSMQSEAQQSQVEVPDAKFDWTSSGLVNPLDCQLNSVSKESTSEEKSTNLDTLPTESSGTFKLPMTDILTFQSETTSNSLPQSDTESVNSLKFTVTDVENELKLDTDSPLDNISSENDFASFESSKPEVEVSWSPMTPIQMPLRETHISEPTTLEPKNLVDKGNWLGSTVNSPELPRKAENIDEDDFSDFQMVLPETKAETVSKPVEPTIMEPLKPIILQPTVISSAPTAINWPEPGIVDVASISEIDLKYSSKSTASEDDDWCDFVSVSKGEAKNTEQKSKSLGGTQFSSNFSNILQSSTNLPNTQLELSVPNLQNTQLRYNALPPMQAAVSSPANNKVNVNIPPSTQQIAAKQVQQGYQPPYQIPLHNTPVSRSSFTLEPTELGPHSTVRKQRSAHTKTTNVSSSIFNEFQSFVSSPKKESQPIQPVLSLFQPVQSVENTFLKMQQSSLPTNSTNDDDDWSDFVSNRTVAVDMSNGWSYNQSSQNVNKNVNVSKPNYSNWSSEVTTNIITNPVHYDLFQTFQPSKNQGTNQDRDLKKDKKSGNNHIFTPSKIKPTVPTISTLPELDFIAPKNKFFMKK